MTGHSVSLTQHISASPGTVWQVLVDVAHAADTLSGVTRVEMLTRGDYDIGTRWRETRTMLGKEETQEMWVTDVVPGRSTTIAGHSSGVDLVTTFTLEPAGDFTDLHMEIGADQASPTRLQQLAWAALGRVGMAVTKRVMRQDLKDIAAAAEAR